MQTNNLMKKNLLLRMALAMLMFAGLSFFNSMQAQVSSTLIGGGGAASQTTPTQNFVAPPVAIQRLEAALVTMKVTLESLQPGTPSYAQLETKALLYNRIMDDIIDGKGVAQAIQDGILWVSSDQFNLPKATVTQYRTELINLLQA
jgi:hypothetical protein